LIAVPRAELPQQPEGEYYWSDLIGLSVENLAGETFGIVDSLLETGATMCWWSKASAARR